MPSSILPLNYLLELSYSPRRRLSTSRRPVACTTIAGNAEEGRHFITNREQILEHHGKTSKIDLAGAHPVKYIVPLFNANYTTLAYSTAYCP